MNKYIFVFPEGGFSNICHIIWKCYEYSLKYNRILVIDTRYISTFSDDIRKYLIFSMPNIYNDDIDVLFNNLIKTNTFYPSSFVDIFKKEKLNYKNIISKLKFTPKGYFHNDINFSIDLKKDYKEDVILFANCGGGPGLLNIFKMSKFHSKLKNIIKSRLKKLPKDYISIHIRNTDKKSNIEEFIFKNKDKFENKSLFVSSDNINSINAVKKIYKDLYCFSDIPDINNKPIHENCSKLNKEDFIIDCISDIILLCYGKEYYYSCEESGYSKNVLILRENIYVINELLK